ncbi:hypothetical protein [Streptomyces sp. NPDC052042]|uniref:hypothetical protein n=1 Tax=Streptomyces sp. NPDC052042 TaxID=3365683 RepID=UPI0037D61913
METDPQDEPLRFVSFEDYLLWRNVGLRGELPEGGADPPWRGRHGERNALFADVLAHSGMRLGEASCLLVPEVPSPGGPAEFRVAGAVAKRRKGRRVFLPPCKVRQLHHFLAVERDAIVARCTADGRFTPAATDRTVLRTGPYALVLDGSARNWPYGRIGPAERRRPVRRTGELLWLWLADDGGRLSQPRGRRYSGGRTRGVLRLGSRSRCIRTPCGTLSPLSFRVAIEYDWACGLEVCALR